MLLLLLDGQPIVVQEDIHQGVGIAVVVADNFVDYRVDSLVDPEPMMVVVRRYFVRDWDYHNYKPYAVVELQSFVVDIVQVVLDPMVVVHTFVVEETAERGVVDILELVLVDVVMHLDMLLPVLMVGLLQMM